MPARFAIADPVGACMTGSHQGRPDSGSGPGLDIDGTVSDHPGTGQVDVQLRSG